MIRLRLTAPLVVARDQPNSCSRGSSSAPVDDRNPAAATKAAIVIPATHQARCTRPDRFWAGPVVVVIREF